MNMPSISLQISTYNWPAALDLCLQSVLRQKQLPSELIIADDGSGPETKAVVDAFAANASFPVKHVWHEDDGFRLPHIRNKGIAAAAADYIIQSDGDCILHPLFVAHHAQFAAKNTFVAGTRSMIDEERTQQLLTSRVLPRQLAFGKHLSKKGNALNNAPLAFVNYILQRGAKHYKYVKGCNMAFWKSDLLQVNGYDERFIGWGKEDNDIALRLIHAGVQIRFAKFSAIQYHLHHREADRSRHNINETLLAETLANRSAYAKDGIVKK